MKKNLTGILLFTFLISTLTAIEIPENLYGIWEGKDRFVFFDQNQDTSQQQVVIFLKEYYGWWIDRSAEPENYKETEKRQRNTGTTKNAEHIKLDFSVISKNTFTTEVSDGTSEDPEIITIDFTNAKNYPEVKDIPESVVNAYQIKLDYSDKETLFIPICINDNKIYLDFYIRSESNSSFYRGNMVTRGITLDTQEIPENTGAYYINYDTNQIYNIRYWKSDMDYDGETQVSWSKNGYDFLVDRHLFSGSTNYSCVSGRSKKIRNPQNSIDFNEEDYIFSQDKSLLITRSEPYLIRLADHQTLEDLFAIVKEQNSKRKSDPPPLFPPDDLNWHWDLIELLEKNNTIIQEVRKRQEAFGSRGH